MKRSVFSKYSELIIIGLFLGGFLLGLVIISLTRESWLPVIPWLEPDFLWKIEEMSVDKRALFFFVSGKRLRAFFLLWLLARSFFPRAISSLFFLYQGFTAGMVMELLIIKYGLKGVGFYLGMVFPQALCYLPGYFLLGVFCLKKRNRVENVGFEGEERGKRRKSVRELMTGLGIIMIGIIMESFVNPELIKKLSEIMLG